VKPAALVVAVALALPRTVAAADWTPPVAVSQACCGAYFPFVLHDDAGEPHLWWVQPDEGEDARWRLRHARGVDGVFMPPQEIGGQLDARVIAGVHAGAALHLVFSAYRTAYGDGCEPGVTGGCSDVYFLESLYAGASWSAPLALPHPDDPVQRYEPTIVRDDAGALVVVYDRDSTLHAVTRDAGGVWGAEVMVTGLHAGQQHSPQITRTASGLHLVFRAKPGPEPGDLLLHTRLVDGAWAEPTPVSPLLGGAQLSAIASDGAQRLQVAFQSSAAGEYAVYFSESLDDGGTWSAPVQLSAPGTAARPSIARELGGETVHVVWDDGAAIAHAEASGGGFTPAGALSVGLEKSLEPHVSAGPLELIAAWHGRVSADGPYQIQVARRAPTDPVPVDPTTGGDDTTGDGTTGVGTTEGMSEGTGDIPTGEPPGEATTGALPDGTTAAGSTGGTGATGGEGGCGCDVSVGPPWWLVLALVRRRRVRAAARACARTTRRGAGAAAGCAGPRCAPRASATGSR
jgi:hypothetical protein